MLTILATTPSLCAGSGAPAALAEVPTAVSTALCARPAQLSYATRGQFAKTGMALSNHNIKVWPLGPQDGSTG